MQKIEHIHANEKMVDQVSAIIEQNAMILKMNHDIVAMIAIPKMSLSPIDIDKMTGDGWIPSSDHE